MRDARFMTPLTVVFRITDNISPAWQGTDDLSVFRKQVGQITYSVIPGGRQDGFGGRWYLHSVPFTGRQYKGRYKMRPHNTVATQSFLHPSAGLGQFTLFASTCPPLFCCPQVGFNFKIFNIKNGSTHAHSCL